MASVHTTRIQQLAACNSDFVQHHPRARLHFTVQPPAHGLLTNQSALFLHCSAVFVDEDPDRTPATRSRTAADSVSPASEPPRTDNDDDGDDGGGSGGGHEPPAIVYSWLRNDRPLLPASASASAAAHLAHFHAFAHNGTLRLSHAKISSGRFRCVADDALHRTGAIVSSAALIQMPGTVY